MLSPIFKRSQYEKLIVNNDGKIKKDLKILNKTGAISTYFAKASNTHSKNFFLIDLRFQ